MLYPKMNTLGYFKDNLPDWGSKSKHFGLQKSAQAHPPPACPQRAVTAATEAGKAKNRPNNVCVSVKKVG